MTDLIEQKQEANELRKTGNFEEALILYRNLWKETGDKFDGAGLLHCLRKLRLFNEAIRFAEELIVKYPDFDWCRNEVIWTLISGTLYKLEENEPLKKVLQTAQKIMDLNPDGLAAKMVVFKILKSAKASNDWETINEWVVKVDPDSLSTEPMTDSSGRKGWSDQSLWYNYRIYGLVKQGDQNEAIILVDEILECFPKQKKFFLRLKALAYYLLSNLTEAEKVYQNLCSSYKPDWWLLHEYARVVRDRGREEDALKLMYQAASSHSKLGSMVSLFEDIGMLCKEMEKYEEARSNLILCKYIREENDWSVPESMISTINDLNRIAGNNNIPPSINEALNACRSEWRKLLNKENDLKNLPYKKRSPQKGLVGKVSLGRNDRSFCFIIGKDEQSFFCYKSDLPSSIIDGDVVTFDAIPSFDKKKNRESWKASNIRHCT
jgi:tetratricopeptide (TPR) repeat protein